jgi:hypothetical protein
VEVNFRPSIHENFEHCQVFDNGKHIQCFLQNEGEFSDTHVNLLVEETTIKVINLLDDYLPKGIDPFEQMFDRNDM